MVVIAFGPDVALVAFDDGAADREADSEPTTFRRVKRLEELVAVLSVDTDASVSYRKADPIGVEVGCNQQRARAIIGRFSWRLRR
jgi:hypothetical protein